MGDVMSKVNQELDFQFKQIQRHIENRQPEDFYDKYAFVLRLLTFLIATNTINLKDYSHYSEELERYFQIFLKMKG